MWQWKKRVTLFDPRNPTFLVLTYHCKRGEGEEDGLRVRPLVGWLLVGPVDAAAAQVKPRLGGDGHHLVHLMRVNRF